MPDRPGPSPSATRRAVVGLCALALIVSVAVALSSRDRTPPGPSDVALDPLEPSPTDALATRTEDPTPKSTVTTTAPTTEPGDGEDGRGPSSHTHDGDSNSVVRTRETPSATEDTPSQRTDGSAHRTLSGDVSLAGFAVPAGEVWEFDPDVSTTVRVSRNVVVEGTLRMRPASPDVVHTLRFVGVDESAYRGGGMGVVASDVGLWVVRGGRLDARGTPRTGWTRLAGPARAGDTALELRTTPTGWRAGDRVLVVPTARAATNPRDFHVHTLRAANGRHLTLAEPLRAGRPAVAGMGAEVANLTRNVRIEGTGDGSFDPSANGRAHVMVMSNRAQRISHAAFRLLGPRQNTGATTRGRAITDGVLGRYPLHFHRMGDAARGSVVDGVVVEQAGNHAIVPHASHGVTVRDTVAYDVWEDAFWWDPSVDGDRTNDSHDLTWTRDLVAVVRDDPAFRGVRLAAFRLGAGRAGSNLLTASVAAGVQGTKASSGYRWPEKGQGVWVFEDNIAHNNAVHGLAVWQNNTRPHVISDYVAYANGAAGIDHGAYRNAYTYRDVTLVGNRWGIAHHANGSGDGQRWQRVRTDRDVRLLHHNLPGDEAVVYTDLDLRDGAKVVVDESGDAGVFAFRSTAPRFDLTPDDFRVRRCLSRVRIVAHDGRVTNVC